MFLARIVIPRSRSSSLVSRMLAHQLAVAEPAALAQHAIDQRGLAVVDVGDDGDVANVFAAHECGVTYFWFEPVMKKPGFFGKAGLLWLIASSCFLALGNFAGAG